jgi:hypothetical protein
MRYKYLLLLLLFLYSAMQIKAQKSFSEGVIVYKVKLESADHKTFAGTYTFTFKGPQLRKELKLDNGFGNIVIMNTTNNSVYSLQSSNDRKYAIELSMADLLKTQEKFNGFAVGNEESNPEKIAGCAAYKGSVKYRDGSGADVLYTKDWQVLSITFERFPGAHFLPLTFSYKDENNTSMQFEAEKIVSSPIENGLFRIPPDYKMISNAEYRKLSK